MASSSLPPLGILGALGVVVLGVMLLGKGFSETESVPIFQEVGPYFILLGVAIAFIVVVVMVKEYAR